MKKNLFIAISLLFIATGMLAQANKRLSNLTSPTSVNVSLLPAGSIDLGSASNAWQNIYLNGEILWRGFHFISVENNTANTFVGIDAGRAITSGGKNSFFGDAAGLSNTTGKSNSFFGQDAGFTNVNGNHNSFFGESSGFDNLNGNYDCFFGYGSGVNNSSGSDNVFIGNNAGSLNTTGNKNTYVGFHAGNTGTNGSSNTLIGYGTDITSASYFNATAIGNLATVGGSNHVHIGNSSVTLIGGNVNWSKFSDARIKNNIRQNVPGLAFINLLTPVTYHIDLNKQESILGETDSSNYEGKNDIEKIQFTGFVAQDVEAAAKKIGYDFSGVNIPKSDKDLYSLCYGDFVVPLVKAVQELSKMNDEKSEAIQQQNVKINDLQKQIDDLKAMIVSNQLTANNAQPAVISSASLQQNIPNPFTNSTTISYSIPQNFSSAKIIVTDKNGNALKQISLLNNKGGVTVDASTLSGGAYQYSLCVDGKVIVSKQMIISK
jgi:hypothetical protein